MLHILITDDDAADRKQIKRALLASQLTAEIIEAQDIPQALRHCEETSFDCIFLDYNMPEFDGLNGLKLFKETSPFSALIMITGQGNEFIAAAAFKNGATDYIPKKSLQTDSIQRIVESALAKKYLQKQLQQQHEALESFAATLAHDLSAPLTLIHGFGELMRTALSNGQYTEIERYCQRICQASSGMQNLIDTLQQYNKASKSVIFNPVESEQTVTAAINNLAETINSRKAQIIYNDLPNVYGCHVQLTQLFQNLLSNAVKYCQADKPCIEITAVEQEHSWLFSVQDNGIGIANDTYETIFQPFKRLHSDDDQQHPGTGLGLATCKKIVERHHGEIWCQANQTQGSTFYFTLAKQDKDAGQQS